MRKNINGKKILDEYIKSMDIVYDEAKAIQDDYYNDRLDDEYFDINKSLKFTRTWEILKSMENVAARNLLLLFNACGCRYKETLDALCGVGTVYKNEATLRYMMTDARKKLKKIYDDKYGTD